MQTKSLRRRGKVHWKQVVSTLPYQQRVDWLNSPEAITFMGAEWCGRQRRELELIEAQLKAVVPSGDWFEAAWNGTAAFPPQEPFCPLAVVAILYGWAAEGRLHPKYLRRHFALLAAGADSLQVLARAGARMRLSRCHSGYGTGRYDDNDQPVLSPPTRRLTPPLSRGFGDGAEDRYDRMSVAGALFCRDAPSVTAVQFRMIEMRRGRDEGMLKGERKAQQRAERRRLRRDQSAARNRGRRRARNDPRRGDRRRLH